MPFVYTGLPARVVFGFGTLADLPSEIRRLGASRALLLCTPRQLRDAQALSNRLGPLGAGVFAQAVMHTPVEVTERALIALRESRADCTVALGGGSPIGLGKALALRTDILQIAVPTTYAGSEATPVLGETRDDVKTTQRSAAILPEVILYDVELSLTLPPSISAASGLNAIAHAAEALYARDANPLTSSLAVQGIQALATALPRVVDAPGDREARARALYGAWLCGVCLATVGMGLHHKLCHTLGGSFELPHAQTHAVLLAHAVAYNSAAAPIAMQRIQQALGVEDAAQGLFDLARRLGAPRSLEQLGMSHAALARAADQALTDPYWSPRPIEREGILSLLEDAYHGRRPRAASRPQGEQYA
jgi:alcohol dehydrogenase class IV